MAFIVIGVVIGFIGLLLSALFAITAIMHDSDINDVD
jgi:ABC-type lipoprotein release transport system permease subunit